MLALLAKGILVGLMIYMTNHYYNEQKNESSKHYLDPKDITITRLRTKEMPNQTLQPKTTTTTIKTTRTPWQSSYQPCGPNMICVPYQRCPNRQWINETVDYNDTEKLCKYMEICCPKGSILSQNTDLEQPPLVYDPRNCNFTWPQVSGMAKDPEYVQQLTLPWTVSLLEDDYGRRHYICSGALISDRLVITDSSCFMLSIFASIKIFVIAGEFGSNLLFPKTQERRVTQRINSRGEENSFLQSDLTMVVLERPFKLNADIQPVCLPPPQEENLRKFSYKHCLSTAFPADKHDSFLMPSLNHRKYELQLRRRFYVNPLNETHCNSFPMPVLTHDSNKHLMSSLRCMGRDEGKDRKTCFSEMGAPIVCEVEIKGEEENSLTYHLVGLGRNTSPCSGLSMPNIVMNVEHYRNWIIQKIKEIHGIDEVI